MHTHQLQAIRTVLTFSAGILMLLTTCRTSEAHTGRRFLVEVANNKLQAQGINSGSSDGAPATRQYTNSIHDHWKNVTPNPASGLDDFATSFLPDFGIPIDASFTFLKDHELTLELISASQWVNPPSVPAPGTIPNLTPLDIGEVISIEATGGLITSDTLGELILSPSVPQTGIEDILLNYEVTGHPTNEIHVLEFVLSANLNGSASSISDSDPIYIILSPDGDTKITKLHYAALYLEEYMATQVPEPSSSILLFVAAAFVLSSRFLYNKLNVISEKR